MMTEFERELWHAWLKKGEESENHKYIRREWKNGRWRYWYKSDSNNKENSSKTTQSAKKTTKIANLKKNVEKAVGITARKDMQTAKSASDKVKVGVSVAKKLYNETREKASRDYYVTDKERSEVAAAAKLYNKRQAKADEAGKDYVAKRDAYMKTPLGKLEANIDKAKEFVKLLSDNRSTLEKWVESKIAEDAAKEEAKIERSIHENYVTAVRQSKRLDDDVAKAEIERIKERKEASEWLQKIRDNLGKLHLYPSLNVKDKASTRDEDMAAINPNYERGSLWDENCAVCTVTYDLRRRGYDVVAKDELSTRDDGSNNTGMTIYDILALYDNPKKKYEDVHDMFMDRVVGGAYLREKYGPTETMKDHVRQVEKEMLSYGDGARGNFCVEWSGGGGHSVSWEVSNGNVIIRDCQTNETHTLDYYPAYIDNCYFIRTDDLVPNQNVLKYVKNRR